METQEKKDVYAIVTDTIIAQLEKGVVPWQKPWGEAGIPRNLITGREYRGINTMLLSSLGYSQNLFLSFQQAKTLGASIKKGQKAHVVVFWKMVDKKAEEEEVQDEQNGKVPVLRYYKVFNVEQCTGIPTNMLPILNAKADFSPIETCDAIVNGMPQAPKIKYGSDGAYYIPRLDIIHMPHAERFKTSESYYLTLYHELIHSTGHESRLKRPGITDYDRFGSEQYSFEELIAEIGTCFLSSYAGINGYGFVNSVAYIEGWLARLKGEKRWIIHASAQAQKAVDYILNIQPHEDADKKE